MERVVNVNGQDIGTVTLDAPVLRHPGNPILTARDVNAVWADPGLQVVTAHNAGVAVIDGVTTMVFRSHLRCGMSVLGRARSADGVGGWVVSARPVMVPATPLDAYGPRADQPAIIEMESGGLEDARLNPVGATIAMTYSAYHALQPNRVRVAMATTADGEHFTRHGAMLDRDMRNVVLFPERIDGRYTGLFRPNDNLPGDTGGAYTRIHLGTTADLVAGPWDIDPDPVMVTGAGPSAFSAKIGPGAPPIRTRHGWLSLFHGVRTTMDGNPYVLGVALHDLADPRIVAMSAIPILFPTAADCRVREDEYVHVPHVVFSCAMTRRPDGTLFLYYAGNDTVMNVAFSHEDVLAELVTGYGQDPLTGRLLYTP